MSKYVDWDMMNSFMIDVFRAYGVPVEDAVICADVLLEADRHGIDSHGCNRFKPIYIDRIENGSLLPKTEMEIIKETPTTVVMDAHDGMGMVASHKMMTMLIDKAGKYGMVGGAIRNSTHYGIAGYWTNMAAKEGMIGITGTNARPSIAPTFGVENMLGTNPLTFSLPTDEEFPFCIDCATSAVQRGKIEYYAREGKDTPAGMVVTQDGGEITDSKEILKMLTDGTAALTPLGGGRQRRQTSDVPSRALLLRRGSGCVHGKKGIQKDRWRNLQAAKSIKKSPRLRKDPYGRRKRISGMAGQKGQGRAGRRRGSERNN